MLLKSEQWLTCLLQASRYLCPSFGDAQSLLPKSMQRDEPRFPKPLSQPLPTNVLAILVDELLHEVDRFGARVSEPKLGLQSGRQGSVTLNAVLNGDWDCTEFCQASWDAMCGIKHWLGCCSQTSLAFLCPRPGLEQSRWAPKTERVQRITTAEHVALQKWARDALDICLEFKAKFPGYLVRHVKPSEICHKDGRFQTAVLKGGYPSSCSMPLTLRQLITDR